MDQFRFALDKWNIRLIFSKTLRLLMVQSDPEEKKNLYKRNEQLVSAAKDKRAKSASLEHN